MHASRLIFIVSFCLVGAMATSEPHAAVTDPARIDLSSAATLEEPDALGLGIPGSQMPSRTSAADVRFAKRRVKIGKIISFFRGKGGGSLRGGSTTGGDRNNAALSQRLKAIGIRGFLIYGLIFLIPLPLLIAAYRFFRCLLRGLFVTVRDAEIIDARMTRDGKFRPIVLFEDRNGQPFRAVVQFETRKDPRGGDAAVEISGGQVRVVPFRRGLGGVIAYVFGPAVLAFVTLIVAYFLDTA